MRTGTVYLVGAGPGDPDLLTVRAARLIANAGVLAPDALVPPAIVALAPASAERLDVGYRCGGNEARVVLHPSIIACARAGRDVVRLKAGDPMIFGRGGEEIEALRALGIPFEIVPGISAAFGAAAAAGIPLTDRRCAGGVALVTGHRADARPSAPTRVLYMARRSLREALAGLRLHGTPAATPAAMIAGATRPEQRVVVGTVADLAARVDDADVAAELPAVVIVGAVVALAHSIENKPSQRYARAG